MCAYVFGEELKCLLVVFFPPGLLRIDEGDSAGGCPETLEPCEGGPQALRVGGFLRLGGGGEAELFQGALLPVCCICHEPIGFARCQWCAQP